METWVIVVAAGAGTRFGGPKVLADLGGTRVLDRSVAAARAVPVDGVIVVAPPEVSPVPGADAVVPGGATRSASVRAGLAAVPDTAGVVVVHDAARPLAPPELFVAVIDAVRVGADGAVPCVAITDTVRHRRHGSLDRSELVAVQTPQAFRAAALRDAHAGADDATDDAALVEAAGGTVVLIDGDPGNIKLTRPADLVVAAALVREAAQ